MSFDILPRLRTRDQSSSIISRFGGFQVFAWPMSPVSYALAFAFNSLYFLLIWIPKRFKVRLGSQVRLHAELHTLCLSRLSARLATLQVQSRNFRLLKLEKLHIAELRENSLQSTLTGVQEHKNSRGTLKNPLGPEMLSNHVNYSPLRITVCSADWLIESTLPKSSAIVSA